MTGTAPTTQEMLAGHNMSEVDVKRNELTRQHRLWLTLPTTQIFKQGLDELLTSIVANTGAAATIASCPDSQIRAFAAQIKQVQTIQKLAFDTDTFVNNATK